MPNDMNKIGWPGWETVRVIGRGSFGTVYEIERKKNCTTMAMMRKVFLPPFRVI